MKYKEFSELSRPNYVKQKKIIDWNGKLVAYIFITASAIGALVEILLKLLK